MLFWERKKVHGCVSQIQIQIILFHGKLKNWVWTLRRDTPENSQDAPGTKLNSGKKKGNLEALSKRWTSWAKSLRARFWGTATWGNLTTSRLYQQSSVEFGEKKCKPNIKLRIILLWRCQRQKIACWLCNRELQCTMLSKEIWAPIQWIL